MSCLRHISWRPQRTNQTQPHSGTFNRRFRPHIKEETTIHLSRHSFNVFTTSSITASIRTSFSRALLVCSFVSICHFLFFDILFFFFPSLFASISIIHSFVFLYICFQSFQFYISTCFVSRLTFCQGFFSAPSLVLNDPRDKVDRVVSLWSRARPASTAADTIRHIARLVSLMSRTPLFFISFVFCRLYHQYLSISLLQSVFCSTFFFVLLSFSLVIL